MQTFNNVQINGWSCSPKHGPAHFMVLKKLFVWMVWSSSKTFELMAGPCSSKRAPVPITVLKNFFFCYICSHLKTLKLMAGPRSRTSFVTAQLNSRRERIVSSVCYADFQQRSTERLVVLPQTRSSSLHVVEEVSRLDGMKLFKNNRTYGWAVLPQTRPSSFHGVEEFFCLDVVQPFRNIQVYGWAALPNIPWYGPAQFAELNNRFVFMLCRLSTTFKYTAGRASLNTVQLTSRCS